jgi:hypothetical protein
MKAVKQSKRPPLHYRYHSSQIPKWLEEKMFRHEACLWLVLDSLTENMFKVHICIYMSFCFNVGCCTNFVNVIAKWGKIAGAARNAQVRMWASYIATVLGTSWNGRAFARSGWMLIDQRWRKWSGWFQDGSRNLCSRVPRCFQIPDGSELLDGLGHLGGMFCPRLYNALHGFVRLSRLHPKDREMQWRILSLVKSPELEKKTVRR